jgi:hypothetical protein
LALSANGEIRDDLSLEKLRLWKMPAATPLLAVELRKSEKMYDQIVCWMATFSSDGRLFAGSQSTASLGQRGTSYADHTLRVWERATGQVLHSMPGAKMHALAFSPSGRLLAAGHGNNEGWYNKSKDSRITVWDMATGESIRVYKGHANEVACVAFSPDGKTLASGSADHTILVWSDISPPPMKPAAEKPTAKELGAWWDDLAGATLSARPATMKLLAHPQQTVQLIGERIKPAPAVDTDRIARLIDLLDSPSFKQRQKAMAALEALGELAEGQLQQVLAGNSSLECRRRAELLLGKLDNAPLAPEQLQVVRAIAILEWIGSAEAENLLGALAKGAPESRLTQLAQAALARMLAAQPGSR